MSAKTHFHNVLLEQMRIAVADGTADLLSWTQQNVQQNGVSQLPVWAANPMTTGPRAACLQVTPFPVGAEPSNTCKLFRNVTWNITGYVDPVQQHELTSQVGSQAKNLALAQNETRISATINVAMTDADGSVVYASQSRLITARVFHAFPYVLITAERDVSSELGSINSSEGDTAGFAQQQQTGNEIGTNPTSSMPAEFTDTTLLTTINCKNTAENTSVNPELDDNKVTFSQLRSVGNLSWVYEVPCDSAATINPETEPSGYNATKDNVYGTTASANSMWQKNNDNRSTFAR